jgi:hypothetical protein
MRFPILTRLKYDDKDKKNMDKTNGALKHFKVNLTIYQMRNEE